MSYWLSFLSSWLLGGQTLAMLLSSALSHSKSQLLLLTVKVALSMVKIFKVSFLRIIKDIT